MCSAQVGHLHHARDGVLDSTADTIELGHASVAEYQGDRACRGKCDQPKPLSTQDTRTARESHPAARISNPTRLMRCARSLSLLLSTMAVMTACRQDRSSSTKDVLARDTALAGDLRKAADTTAYGDAADVAMAELPDSGLSPMRVSTSPAGHLPRAPIPRDRTPAPAPTATASGEVASSDETTRSAATSSATIPAQTTAPPRSTESSSVAADSPPTPACASPATPDQRRCLMTYLARSDAGLDRTYQLLIAEMKRRAGTASGDPEPDAVLRLREAQRAWLVYRDTECRRRNRAQEGPLWAPMRAQCLGEFSGRRAEDLAASLARLQGR